MDTVKKKYSEFLLDSPEYYDTPHMEVNSRQLIATIVDLRDNHGFTFLCDIFASHHPDQKDQEFQIHYNLYNMNSSERLIVMSKLAKGKKMEVPSMTGIYRAANWLERETYDFYGITFIGHPDLRRILNMYEMTEFPLRKEFPLEDPDREDKDNKYFGR